MKVAVTVMKHNGATLEYLFSSIRQCAREMCVDPRGVSGVMRGRIAFKETPFGTIVKVEDASRETDSTTSQVREYSNWLEENPPLGSMAVYRGWGRVKQALVEVASYVQRVFGQFC